MKIGNMGVIVRLVTFFVVKLTAKRGDFGLFIAFLVHFFAKFANTFEKFSEKA